MCSPLLAPCSSCASFSAPHLMRQMSRPEEQTWKREQQKQKRNTTEGSDAEKQKSRRRGEIR
eukprot:15732227-Heterocapsa_arctica.AAC.1